MAKVQLNFEYDFVEEYTEYQIQSKAKEFFCALLEIEVSMRDSYKNDELCNDHADALIEKWRSIISETGIHSIN